MTNSNDIRVLAAHPVKRNRISKVLASLLVIGTLAGGCAVTTPTKHITIDWKRADASATKTYAVSKATLCAEKKWLAHQRIRPSQKQVKDWLENHGGQLDHQIISFWPAPARPYTIEQYFRNGLAERQDGPALIILYPDSTKIEQYFHNDQLDRRDGPAIIWRNAKGAITNEGFYENGKLIREERLASPSTTIGTPDQPPAPKSPDKPGAPNPA